MPKSKSRTQRLATEAPSSIAHELASLVTSAATSGALFDTSMKYLAASSSWISELGLEGRAVVGRSHYEVFPEIPERWKDVYRRALEGETVVSELDLFARESGRVQWLRWSVTPWRHEHGAIGGVMITASDVSEVGRLRIEVAEFAREFDLLFERAGTALVLTDDSGRILRASTAFAAMCGMASSSLVGQVLDEFLAQECEDAGCPDVTGKMGDFVARFVELRHGRRPVADGRVFLACAGSVRRWAHCVAVRLNADAIATARFVVALQDESGRIALERRIREADRISSLGMLSAGLGHELGNILLPMQAHLNAAKAASVDSASSDRFQTHLVSINAGLSTLRRLADGARYFGGDGAQGLEAGRSVPTDGCARPTEWWPSVDGLLRCVLPPATVFEVDVPTSCPAPRVQPNVLLQSLLNLLVNARDAVVGRHGADGRGGDVRVAFVGIGRGTSTRVRISVRDNGEGMDESTLTRAREPFFTTKPRNRGTGLGLAMVAATVEECGGQLLIRSVVNSGTEVTLTLPAVRSPRA